MPVDVSEWLKAFDGLNDLKVSLASRMAVEAGVIVRDDAKERAPEADPFVMGYNAEWKTGSTTPGALRDAIYLSRSDSSNDTQVVYSVSWNSREAFWGVFVEFGFEMTDMVIGASGVGFWTVKGVKRPGGSLQVKAQPFLAPALDSNIQRIATAAIARGREELPKLLAEIRR